MEELPVSFGHDHEREESEMDMTPMVDVTFLLLIFFMVTAAFTMQKSFEVPTPKSEQSSTNAQTIEDFEDQFIIVRIDEYNTFHVAAPTWDEEEEVRSAPDLIIKLRKAREDNKQGAAKLLVMASGECAHGKVVTAMDAGNDVGMEEVKLVTFEDDGF